MRVRLCALLILAAWAFLALEKLRTGTALELFWVCHLTSLGLGIGLLTRRWTFAAGCFLFHAVGWIGFALHAFAEGTTLASGLSHTASPLLGAIALHDRPWPRALPWLMAALQPLLFAPIGRLLPEAANINLAWRSWADLAIQASTTGLWLSNALALLLLMLSFDAFARLYWKWANIPS